MQHAWTWEDVWTHMGGCIKDAWTWEDACAWEDVFTSMGGCIHKRPMHICEPLPTSRSMGEGMQICTCTCVSLCQPPEIGAVALVLLHVGLQNMQDIRGWACYGVRLCMVHIYTCIQPHSTIYTLSFTHSGVQHRVLAHGRSCSHIHAYACMHARMMHTRAASMHACMHACTHRMHGGLTV